MKTINESFTDKEHEKLSKAKGSQTWHDFIMRLAPSDWLVIKLKKPVEWKEGEDLPYELYEAFEKAFKETQQ